MTYFASISVRHLGPIDVFDATFAPYGVNLICGPNESGKTHLAATLAACVAKNPLSWFRTSAGRDAIQSGESTTHARINICDATGFGFFGILAGSDSAGSAQRIAVQDCPQAQRLREVLGTEPHARWYWGPGNSRSRQGDLDWQRLSTLLELNLAHPQVIQFFKQAAETPSRVRSAACVEAIGLGQAFQEILDRATPHPLIFDNTFGLVDQPHLEVVAELLRIISLRHQVILFATAASIKDRVPCATEHYLATSRPLETASRITLAASPEDTFTTDAGKPAPLPQSQEAAKATIIQSVTPYFRALDATASSQDSGTLDSLVDDLARASSATVLRTIQATLLQEIKQEIKRQLGTLWLRLHPHTQTNLTNASYLASFDGEQFLRLAVFSICVAIEIEIKDKIFVPFVKLLRSTGSDYPRAAPTRLAPKPAESYRCLLELISGAAPHLTMGSFPWILKAARCNRQEQLFADLMHFIEATYGRPADDICYLIESIAFRTKCGDDRIAGRILEIRNACAHGRAEPFEAAAARELFDMVWGFAFREPLELLRKLAMPRTDVGK